VERYLSDIHGSGHRPSVSQLDDHMTEQDALQRAFLSGTPELDSDPLELDDFTGSSSLFSEGRAKPTPDSRSDAW
jgi:hypothetical protein